MGLSCRGRCEVLRPLHSCYQGDTHSDRLNIIIKLINITGLNIVLCKHLININLSHLPINLISVLKLVTANSNGKVLQDFDDEPGSPLWITVRQVSQEIPGKLWQVQHFYQGLLSPTSTAEDGWSQRKILIKIIEIREEALIFKDNKSDGENRFIDECIK